MKKEYKLLGILVALYITFQLISDITAGKIISLFNLNFSVTVLYFPITYIIADILTEVYGYKESRRVTWIVFMCSIIAGCTYTLVAYLPPAIGFDGNDAYTKVLGNVPRILIGGWIAVWVGGILNDYTLAKMKIFTKGKLLWTRTISSTIIGEGANTTIFYTIGLYGVIPNNLLITSILAGWGLKTIIEILFTPLTYWVIAKVKKIENEDYYDNNTDFNPFKLS